MPVRIQVDLDPAEPGTLAPRHSGHAVSAAVLAAIRDVASPGLSGDLHSPPGYKPYTVTPLLSNRHQPAADTAGPVWFGLSLLSDDLAGPALSALEATPEFRVGRAFYRSVKVTVPMAATYEELLAQATTATTWEINLVTPAGFATAAGEGPRREIPWPTPARTFAGLARRWAYFAPGVPLPEETSAVIRAHVEVADFDLRMARHLVKPGEPERRGAVGRVTYRLTAAKSVSPAAIRAVDALVQYSQYAGLGDRTGMGMGYVCTSSRGRG